MNAAKKTAPKTAAPKKAAPAKPAAPKAAAPKKARGKEVAFFGVPSPKTAAPKTAAKKAAPKTEAPRKAAPKKAAAPTAKKMAPRADFGAPIDAFFEKQPPAMRAILEALRSLVDEVVPDADSSLKWGQPFYSYRGGMMCALAGHKAHVNLILSGPEGAFPDPKGLLSGEGKTGRHMKITSVDQIPRPQVKAWLKIAKDLAASKAK